MRIYLIIFLFCLNFFQSGKSLAQENCLDEVATFSERICGAIEVNGNAQTLDASGQLNAEASGIVKRILGTAEAGANSSYAESAYEGVLRDQLAADRFDVRVCRREMVNIARSEVCNSQGSAFPVSIDNFEVKEEFDEYRVGRRATNFGSNIVIRQTDAGDKYASGRSTSSNFSFSSIPVTNNLSIDIRLYVAYVSKRKVFIEINTSDGSSVGTNIYINGNCCNSERIDFDGIQYLETRKMFSWDSQGYNDFRIELYKGDLSVFVNDKYINTYIADDNSYITSFTIGNIGPRDAITSVSLRPAEL